MDNTEKSFLCAAMILLNFLICLVVSATTRQAYSGNLLEPETIKARNSVLVRLLIKNAPKEKWADDIIRERVSEELKGTND